MRDDGVQVAGTYARWQVVLGATLGLTVGNGPMMQFTFGVFLAPLTKAFRADRAVVSSALTLGLCATGLAVPVAGRLVDRFGVRVVTLPAVFLCAFGMVALGILPRTATDFIVVYGLVGIAWAGHTPLPYARAVADVFDHRRGLALGLAMAGVGLGAAIVPPVAALLIDRVGWRTAYVALGAILLVVAVPAVLLLGRPGRSETEAPPPPGPTAREAVGTGRFWLLAAAFFSVAVAASGTTAHLVPLLADHGVPAAKASTVLSVAGLALIGGRLAAGTLLDRVFAPYVAIGFFILPLGGIVLLLNSATLVAGDWAAVLIGLGLGAEIDLIAFLQARYFGRRAFGELYGWLFALFMLGSGIGPWLMGMSFVWFGRYDPALVLFAGLLALACLLVGRLGPYAFGPSDYPLSPLMEQPRA